MRMGNRKQVLIDLKEAIEKVCENCCCDFEECKRIGFCVDYTNIERLPTVDAVEVVHGYWIDSTSVDHIGRIIEHSIDCSVCDSVFKDDSRAVVKHWKERFKVCPFCGAKMDGDGNG